LNASIVSSHVKKIFVGAIIWVIFYLYVFFDQNTWKETLFGQLFGNTYSPGLRYGIQAVFFLILNMNLYRTVLGKRTVIFDSVKKLNVLILVSSVVLVVQTYALYSRTPFHYGIMGYLYQRGTWTHGTLSPFVYGLYTFSSIMLATYLAGLLVYVYQIFRMGFGIPFFIVIRLLIVAVVYGLVLGHTPGGFDYATLILQGLYVLTIFVVYLLTKHSIKGLVFSAFLLFII
jgi:hypothetical protein